MDNLAGIILTGKYILQGEGRLVKMITIYDLLRRIKRTLKKMPFVRNAVEMRNRRLNEKLVNSYHEDGPRVAYSACKTLENAGITAWLYAGSLLGIVRDGDFIPWDNDLDLCIVAGDNFDWTFLERTLADAGYEKIREFTCNNRITEQAYSFGASHFDIFAMEPLDNESARIYLYMDLPDESYRHQNELSVLYLDTYIPFGKELVNVRGWDLPIPENAEGLLEKQYGSNWKTPNPSFNHESTYKRLKGAVGTRSLFLR